LRWISPRSLALGALALAIGLGLLAAVALRGDPEPAARTAADISTAELTFSDGLAQVDLGELHYVIGGRGPAILLIPGFPESWYAWRKLMPRLARTHTVIAVDPPGVGDSSIPAAEYDARDLAGSLAQLLREIGERRAAVVGHDLGGWTAYALARFHPDRVSRLAVLGAGLPGFGLERRLDPAAPDGVTLPHVVLLMQPSASVLLEGSEDELISRFLAPDEARPGTFDGGAATEYLRGISRPGRLDAALAPYRALPADVADNRSGGAPPLRLPVLGLDGERAGGELNLRTLRRAAPGAQTELVPDAGHFLPEERPGYLAARLLRFLG